MLLLAGDINLKMFRPEMLQVKRCNNLLDSLILKQMVTKATRITKTSKTLIDDIITNVPKRISYTKVLTCPLISDHDAPYACVNVRIIRYKPRHKLIREGNDFLKRLLLTTSQLCHLRSCMLSTTPMTLNRLVTECLDRHSSLKRTKVTRPPAPWLNDSSIRSLQVNLANQRREAHARPPKEGEWDMFRYTRNKLKNLIKKAKQSFMITALSSKRPKEVWRTIHRILLPSQQPLRADPDDLNRHFASTAEPVSASSPVLNEDIYRLIDRLTDDSHSSFRFIHVTHQEVLRQVRDCDRTARPTR